MPKHLHLSDSFPCQTYAIILAFVNFLITFPLFACCFLHSPLEQENYNASIVGGIQLFFEHFLPNP